MSDLSRECMIEILEKSLEWQLRALRSLKRPQPPRGATRKGKKSNMSIVEDILRSARSPLHIDEIIRQAQARFNRPLSRESLVSALTKKVLDENTFCRVDRNTFDLIHRSPKEE
jgi:hypothetical protein